MQVPQAAAGRLPEAISGDVIARGEAGWDAARQAWNLTADQRPPLVVLAESEADVAATVRFAAANGLRVAPQSTGHGATDIQAMGSYENAPRTLVYSVVGSDELRAVMRKIKEADPDAFINVIQTERLTGNFRLRPND